MNHTHHSADSRAHPVFSSDIRCHFMNPQPSDRTYSLSIHFFDHTSLAIGLGDSTSPLLPKTPTLLPPKLDQQLRTSQSRLVLPRTFFHSPLPSKKKLDKGASSVASNLVPSSQPTTRIWSESATIIPPRIATKDLYTPSQSLPKSQAAVLDYRFGPISLDFIDNPAPVTSSMSPPTSPTLAVAPGSSTGTSHRSAGSTSTPGKPLETSGSTDLYWGTIHLYTRNSKLDKDKHVATAEDGTILGMVSVPKNLTAAFILSFIAPALDSIAQIRMLKYASLVVFLSKFRN